MENLAWFSMRCVMEPVPDFAVSIADHECAVRREMERFRILYHPVLVSARVVVIGHRNVIGQFAHAIVFRALLRAVGNAG